MAFEYFLDCLLFILAPILKNLCCLHSYDCTKLVNMAAIAVFQDQENVIQEQGKNLSARSKFCRSFSISILN